MQQLYSEKTIMLKPSPLLPRLSFASFTRIYSRKMSGKAPICPKFIPAEGADVYSRSKSDGISFRLVSYNILAQVYVKSSFFPHSPSSCLKQATSLLACLADWYPRWKTRSKAILSVLQNLGADFLCLQELDEDKFYKGNLEAVGYSGIYIQRSGQKRDGCGIFYKQNCAELLVEDRIEYNDLLNSIEDKIIPCGGEQNEDADPKNGSSKETTSEDHGDVNDPYVRLKRDCVGIMAAFRLKGPFDHVVIIANTHLYWDPELADVKLAQAKYLLSRLARFKTLISDRFECKPSVFVTGDFNSVPNDKVYQYLTSGYSSSTPQVEFSEELPIPLCSVYAFTRGEPPFTNCTPDFTDTLDYIFFSPSDCIKPVSTLELPNADSPDVIGGLPNHYHPSDHLPIGAEFYMTRE